MPFLRIALCYAGQLSLSLVVPQSFEDRTKAGNMCFNSVRKSCMVCFCMFKARPTLCGGVMQYGEVRWTYI